MSTEIKSTQQTGWFTCRAGRSIEHYTIDGGHTAVCSKRYTARWAPLVDSSDWGYQINSETSDVYATCPKCAERAPTMSGTETTTIEQSTTEPGHARKWLTDSGLETDAATRLMSASQHNPGREQANGACKVRFTLAHSTRHGFQQNTWTITRPITPAAR